MPTTSSKTRRTTRRPRRKTESKAPSKTFNSKVMRVIKSNNETKMKVWNIFNNEAVIGTGLYYGEPNEKRGLTLHNLLGPTNIKGCNLERGTNQEQFIGNQITNAKITLRGFVYSCAYSANTNNNTLPFEFNLIFYKNKTTNYGSPNGLAEYPANTIGHIADVRTSCYPLNRDAYIIKKRLKWIMRPMPKDVDGDLEAIENPQTSNNMAFRRFSITIPLRKLIKYNDGEVSPENEWLGMGIYLFNGNGADQDEDTVRARVYMDGTITYQDA